MHPAFLMIDNIAIYSDNTIMNLDNYTGGKGVVFRNIINQMPAHETFVEAFVGGGAVFKNKLPAKRNILIDCDPAVTAAWVKHFRDLGYNIEGIAIYSDATGHLATNGDAARYEIYTADAFKLLPMLNLDHTAVVYADPPYLFSSRLQKRNIYKYEMGHDRQHVMLIEMLNSLQCKIMLSGYPSALYDRLLSQPKWHVFAFNAYDRARNLRQEKFWANFAQTDNLHDFRYIGDTAHEREKYRRMAKRWVRRFQKLSPRQFGLIRYKLKKAEVFLE